MNYLKGKKTNYEKELADQIKRTKTLIKLFERATKQFSTLWFIAIYMAILLSIILIKQIWW